MPSAAALGNVGIGLRQPHYRALFEAGPALAFPAWTFLEVHSENFHGEGGAAQAVLQRARADYDISLHGVGLSLGSACGLDDWHLEQLARLVDRFEPVRISDHASFARVPARSGAAPLHLNDLLPVARTAASLDILVANVSRVQDRLRRTILVENVAAYLRWADDAIPEPAFFDLLARRTGCGLLLDVNNLVVNALNAGEEPIAAACAWVDAINAGIVGEIHLAGYDDLGDIVIDDHGSRVHAPVWAAYRHAVARLGAIPTLIEWDTGLPPLEVLLGEAELAAAVQAEAAVVRPVVCPAERPGALA